VLGVPMKLDERRLAAANALRRVRAEREIAFRPLCRDCRFGPVRETDPDKCEHFAHWRISPDRRLRIAVTTAHARSESGLCGPEALMFEPYRRWRRVAQWLARRKPADASGYIWLGIIGAGTAIVALYEAIN
jgi:hypothetical protein